MKLDPPENKEFINVDDLKLALLKMSDELTETYNEEGIVNSFPKPYGELLRDRMISLMLMVDETTALLDKGLRARARD